MARKAQVGAHIKRVHAHHRRHKQHLLRLFHRVRTHPGCYKAGHSAHRGAMPKSLPKQPRGLNKRGAGLWSAIKRGWSWLTGHAKKHVHKIKKEAVKQVKKHGKVLWDEAKSRGSAYAKKQLGRAADWGHKQVQAVGAKARAHAEHYIKTADAKVNSIASRVDSAVSKYSGEGKMPGRVVKKGSGWVGNVARRR